MLEKLVQFHLLLNDKLHEQLCHAEVSLLQTGDTGEANRVLFVRSFQYLLSLLSQT